MDDLICGINPVFEALRGSRRKALELLVAQGTDSPRLASLVSAAEKARIPIRRLDRRELTRLADGERHQGVLLRVEAFEFVDLTTLVAAWRGSGRKALFLLLDGITDPHNFGALVRTADAAGCHGVIVPRDRSCPVTSAVNRAAAGALAHMPLCRVTNIARTLEYLKGEGVWAFGLAGDEGTASLYAADLAVDLVLVIGSEGKGLRDNVRRHCDGLLAIPMAGELASLNASVAGGVALFEAVRQRAD
jgi:23S rRNA (guanosine2251-2'-O)-methyltransferase